MRTSGIRHAVEGCRRRCVVPAVTGGGTTTWVWPAVVLPPPNGRLRHPASSGRERRLGRTRRRPPDRRRLRPHRMRAPVRPCRRCRGPWPWRPIAPRNPRRCPGVPAMRRPTRRILTRHRRPSQRHPSQRVPHGQTPPTGGVSCTNVCPSGRSTPHQGTPPTTGRPPTGGPDGRPARHHPGPAPGRQVRPTRPMTPLTRRNPTGMRTLDRKPRMTPTGLTVTTQPTRRFGRRRMMSRMPPASRRTAPSRPRTGTLHPRRAAAWR